MQKRGFYWYNATGQGTGAQPPVTCPNPTGINFYLESLRIFLGSLPHSQVGNVDFNVQVAHTNGQLIELVAADRYANTMGIEDVSALRRYSRPWAFAPGDGIVVTPYCAGGPGAEWHVIIHAEGYCE